MTVTPIHDVRPPVDMAARGWKAGRIHPFENGVAWTKDVGGDETLLVRFVGRGGRARDAHEADPAAPGWLVTRERRIPRSQGRKRWHLSSLAGLDLASAVHAAEALPPLVRNRSVDHWSLEGLLAAAAETAARAAREAGPRETGTPVLTR